MRYLTISEILELHEYLLASSGGAAGIWREEKDESNKGRYHHFAG